MRRGDIVLVALPGDYGKPRPAVIVQTNVLNATDPPSYIVCPLSTTISAQPDFRVRLEPSPTNGLRAPSEIMIDKVTATPARRLRDVVGACDSAVMRGVDRALLIVLGIT